MSLAQNKALAQRWFEEVWNQGKESTKMTLDLQSV